MCGRISLRSGTMVCDHVEPHRGDETLFWDPENLQTLCADPCHNRHKQMLEGQQ
nr:HNH endonuclease [Rhizobium sp. BK316]